MKIIRANRGEGKTTELIKKSNKDWKYIVCTDITRVTHIAAMANKMGLDIPFPLTVKELPLKQGQRIDSVLIDDIEDVLPLLINRSVDYITTSCDIEKIDSRMNNYEAVSMLMETLEFHMEGYEMGTYDDESEDWIETIIKSIRQRIKIVKKFNN